MSLNQSKRVGVTGLVVVLALVGATWASLGGWFSSGDASTGAEQSRLSVESLKKTNPADFMKLMRAEDLTDEEREELRRNARQARMERMREAMNEYFTAPEDQKVAILDRQIDEWVEMRKRMRERMEEDPPSEEERQKWRERMQSRMFPSFEERKERLETAQSESRSRMMAYFAAARSRAQKRGLEMSGGRGGWGRPRGSGGPGGGSNSSGRRRGSGDNS